MASTYLTRSLSSAGSLTTFTISAWVKRSNLGASNTLFQAQANAGYFRLQFDTNNKIQILDDNSGVNKTTSQVFRDTSAWYHLVFAFNSTQSTSSLRDRLYVNGEEVTSWSTNTPSTQTNSYRWQENNQLQNIGRHGGNSEHYNGLMSHVNCVDGLQLSASDFGSTDSTTGEWKINTSPSVTYGTNGFFILKDGNSVTDQSGRGNNFTVGGGTLTKTEDNPSNVFATGNRLNVNSGGVGTFQYGNNDITVNGASGSQFGSSSTLGMTTGKFYCEAKIITVDSTMIGVSPSPSEDARNDRSPSGGSSSGAVGCLVETGNKYVSGNGTTYGAATSANGIMMIALDLDNLKVYFGSGGQWSNGSGAWNQSGLTSGAALSLTAVASTAEGAYFFSFGDGGGSATGRVQWNFGNGYFGTTAVSSAGTNASGNGIFEYDVPTGFTALSTKGLNL